MYFCVCIYTSLSEGLGSKDSLKEEEKTQRAERRREKKKVRQGKNKNVLPKRKQIKGKNNII